jgi:hypothetical protein
MLKKRKKFKRNPKDTDLPGGLKPCVIASDELLAETPDHRVQFYAGYMDKKKTDQNPVMFVDGERFGGVRIGGVREYKNHLMVDYILTHRTKSTEEVKNIPSYEVIYEGSGVNGTVVPDAPFITLIFKINKV